MSTARRVAAVATDLACLAVGRISVAQFEFNHCSPTIRAGRSRLTLRCPMWPVTAQGHAVMTIDESVCLKADG